VLLTISPGGTPLKQGLSNAIVEGIIQRLETDGKIKVIGNKLAILKWGKHLTKSPDVRAGVIRVLSTLSGDCLQTLMGLSIDSPYILPPGCTWKTVKEGIESLKQLDLVDSVGTVYRQSGDYHVPYLTLPNQTTLGGGLVGGVEEKTAKAVLPPVGGFE